MAGKAGREFQGWFLKSRSMCPAGWGHLVEYLTLLLSDSKPPRPVPNVFSWCMTSAIFSCLNSVPGCYSQILPFPTPNESQRPVHSFYHAFRHLLLIATNNHSLSLAALKIKTQILNMVHQLEVESASRESKPKTLMV